MCAWRTYTVFPTFYVLQHARHSRTHCDCLGTPSYSTLMNRSHVCRNIDLLQLYLRPLFLFLAESPFAYTRSATPKKLSCSVFGPNTRDPECKKQTLSTRGLDKTSLNHSVYVVLPSRRTEEFTEKYLKKRTNEACVLLRCISWHDCGVSSDVRANIIVYTSSLSDIRYNSS